MHRRFQTSSPQHFDFTRFFIFLEEGNKKLLLKKSQVQYLAFSLLKHY